MKHLLIYTIALFLMIAGFNACDSTTSPRDLVGDSPSISDFSISPKSVQYTEEEHGYSDTTVTIQIQGTIKNFSENDLIQYSISSKGGETIFENTIANPENGLISESLQLETTTTTIQDYIINVYVNDEHGEGNYAQAKFEVIGFSNFPPEILEVDNPEEFQRPSSGTENVSFTAKVTDFDGQHSIEGVFLRLFSQVTGEAANSPFELFDNGISQGDEAANDSVYTLTFPVSSTNRPETYDIHYYAVDKGGLVSDTLKTTFSIVE